MGQINRNLVVAYLLDWIIIIAVAAAGGSLSFVTGYRRPFALADPAISYPLRSDIVPFSVVAVIALVAPVVIIVVLSFCSVAAFSRKEIRQRMRHQTWNINAGCSGLCLSLAAALFVTEGLKTIVGKPRPNMLATCHADLTNIGLYEVGGLGTSLLSEAPILVSAAICRQPNHKKLRDAFSSFPSGHASFSWAGLLYLSLWLCAKWSVRIPYLEHYRHPASGSAQHELEAQQRHSSAPPLWLVLAVAIPVGSALFISASRYADFHHADIDIFAGSVIGIVAAWTSFRLYHMPIRRGNGMAWGLRQGHRTLTGGLLCFETQPWRPTPDPEANPQYPPDAGTSVALQDTLSQSRNTRSGSPLGP